MEPQDVEVVWRAVVGGGSQAKGAKAALGASARPTRACRPNRVMNLFTSVRR